MYEFNIWEMLDVKKGHTFIGRVLADSLEDALHRSPSAMDSPGKYLVAARNGGHGHAGIFVVETPPRNNLTRQVG